LEADEKLEKLGKLLAELEGRWIFVEGQKDKKALARLGYVNVLTISGNLRQSCERLNGQASSVVVLTDLDRRGDELAKKAREELEACSIRAEIDLRRRLAYLLNIRHFEDAERGYERLRETVEKGRKVPLKKGENNG
jgi:5S rRNA maturation endonuclease (ribonuclease M5)